MKSINKYIGLSLLTAGLGLTSCNDFLDKLPDNRMELKNPSEVGSLLVSAYSEMNPAYLLETYSDNTDCLENTGWVEMGRFQRQAYQWDDITEIDDPETPQELWNGYYKAIATANAAIMHIDGLDASERESYKQQLGEALLCRAYHEFVLSTVFCEAYDETTADSRLGIPYPEAPETVVGSTAERGTLAEVYQKIDADLTRGLPLVGNTYDHPKFHFNTDAAYAFAARFYLFYHKYDKAIECATKVLTADPTTKLRNWAAWNKLSKNQQIQPTAYISSAENANFLIQIVQSEWGVIIGPYLLGDKYMHGEYLAQTETLNSPGPWGNSGNMNYGAFSNSALSKYVLRKIPYNFEVTDVQSGIGYAHSGYSVFNGDETLLVRAEAYALQKEYDKAVADLNTELSVFHRYGVQLTLDRIVDFYNGVSYYRPEAPTVKKQFHTSFPIEETTQEPLLQCILHLRRLVTIHEGHRLQDIKRYGMKIYRRTFNANNDLIAVTDSLEPGDFRFAIQLPQDVISAGLPANPRK